MIYLSVFRSFGRLPRRYQCHLPINPSRNKSSTSAWPTITDILRPNVVEDDEAIVDGDGSNAYQNQEESGERWEVPRVPLMDFSLDGRTPFQIYAEWDSPISYYIRMDETPKDGKNLACFLRHRGPPILPSSEVVYVVHPYLTTQMFNKGTAPESLEQKDYDRVCRAFSGEDTEGARILASIFHSPANLRALPNNVAALGTIFLRSHDPTAEGPDYKNCWARSTAWAHAQYLKIIDKQYNTVTESIGNAVRLITADKHRNGDFEERFRKDFEERLMDGYLDEIYGQETKKQKK